MPRILSLSNGRALEAVPAPLNSQSDWSRWLASSLAEGAQLAALFGEAREKGVTRLHGILAWPQAGHLQWGCAEVLGEYPSLTPGSPQAHLFEREIYEEFGVKPLGHPCLKPVRFPDGGRPGLMDFVSAEGGETHEVAVGPVHAGVIEPGHFRFICHGETVLHLEIALGYQHRGVEAALKGGPYARTPYQMEALAGDSTVAHAWAYHSVLEALAGRDPLPRGQAIRCLALELERLANHVGDLGALAGDVGFLPTMSFCGRLRGDFLNLTALLCGSRFGRGLLGPGGVFYDLTPGLIRAMQDRLDELEPDLWGALKLLRETSSVLDRFEFTGVLPPEAAADLGLVGPALRASAHALDCRVDFPLPGCPLAGGVSTQISLVGDVRSRAMVRVREIAESLGLTRRLLDHLARLPQEAINASLGFLRPQSLAVSLVEGWRGMTCHAALTDERGTLALYKIVDPSFHNWQGLAMAMRGQQISDFPLCNKSFNLSYCGHDL